MKVSFFGPYTNTVIGFFIFIFIVVQFIKFVSYFVGIVQHPEIKRKFPFFSFIVSLFFAFSLVVVLVLSVVARPSPSVAIASTPTRRIPTMTSVPTHPPLTPSVAECLKWDQLTASMAGDELPCVYGDVVNYVENPTLNATYFYFGSQQQFYFVISDMYYPDFEDGDCAQSSGVIKLDTYKTPYIKIAELYTCE